MSEDPHDDGEARDAAAPDILAQMKRARQAISRGAPRALEEPRSFADSPQADDHPD
jgi:hypothetical protein